MGETNFKYLAFIIFILIVYPFKIRGKLVTEQLEQVEKLKIAWNLVSVP